LRKTLRLLSEVRKDENGAVLAEYAVLIGIVAALVAAAVFTNLGNAIHTQFTTVCTDLGTTC
jgi:Flp pilus assembly pilin Flp